MKRYRINPEISRYADTVMDEWKIKHKTDNDICMAHCSCTEFHRVVVRARMLKMQEDDQSETAYVSHIEMEDRISRRRFIRSNGCRDYKLMYPQSWYDRMDHLQLMIFRMSQEHAKLMEDIDLDSAVRGRFSVLLGISSRKGPRKEYLEAMDRRNAALLDRADFLQEQINCLRSKEDPEWWEKFLRAVDIEDRRRKSHVRLIKK